MGRNVTKTESLNGKFPRLQPLMSEKSLGLAEEKNTYVFITETWLKKPQIKSLIEKIYGVQVEKVRTTTSVSRIQKNRFGNFGGNTFKKTFVRLKDGSKINLTAGV